jgi:hypothetical protein
MTAVQIVENDRTTALAPTPPASTVVVNAGSLFGAIIRATESGVDLDKVERMMGLYERVKAGEAKAAWIAAMTRAQPLLPVIRERGKNAGTNSKFALWEDINEAIRAPLASSGLTLTFRVNISDKQASVTAIVSHSDGHSEETTVPVPVEAVNRGMNNSQAVGSAISYGKRYAAAAILNLTSTGEDDDGKKAGAGGLISADDVAALREKMVACGLPEARFCERLAVASVEQLPASRYDEAERRIMDFARAKGVTP